ncbi:hypothetical protein OIO90_002944 [Microbotryomycetes sp. JL221]|nr:hypothetical protein OIO90_002944 [Microbotryomycetes sp. JL221]
MSPDALDATPLGDMSSSLSASSSSEAEDSFHFSSDLQSYSRRSFRSPHLSNRSQVDVRLRASGFYDICAIFCPSTPLDPEYLKVEFATATLPVIHDGLYLTRELFALLAGRDCAGKEGTPPSNDTVGGQFFRFKDHDKRSELDLKHKIHRDQIQSQLNYILKHGEIRETYVNFLQVSKAEAITNLLRFLWAPAMGLRANNQQEPFASIESNATALLRRSAFEQGLEDARMSNSAAKFVAASSQILHEKGDNSDTIKSAVLKIRGSHSTIMEAYEKSQSILEMTKIVVVVRLLMLESGVYKESTSLKQKYNWKCQPHKFAKFPSSSVKLSNLLLKPFTLAEATETSCLDSEQDIRLVEIFDRPILIEPTPTQLTSVLRLALAFSDLLVKSQDLHAPFFDLNQFPRKAWYADAHDLAGAFRDQDLAGLRCLLDPSARHGDNDGPGPLNSFALQMKRLARDLSGEINEPPQEEPAQLQPLTEGKIALKARSETHGAIRGSSVCVHPTIATSSRFAAWVSHGSLCCCTVLQSRVD